MRLIDRLEKRYSTAEWVFLREVAPATGFVGNTRYCDAIAINIWPSRGLERHGFELKESRSDWLSELKKPEKAERFFSLCHRWSLVVSDRSIVKDTELPSGWGLMVSHGEDSLKTVVEPSRNTPQPISDKFAIALLRRQRDQCEERVKRIKSIDADVRLSDAYKKGIEAEAKRSQSAVDRANKDLRELQKRVSEFESATGIRVSNWDIEGKKREIAVLQCDNGRERILSDIDRIEKKLLSFMETAGDAIEGFKASHVKDS